MCVFDLVIKPKTPAVSEGNLHPSPISSVSLEGNPQLTEEDDIPLCCGVVSPPSCPLSPDPHSPVGGAVDHLCTQSPGGQTGLELPGLASS